MFDLNLPKKKSAQEGGNIIQIMVLISFAAVIFITVLYLWFNISNEYQQSKLLQKMQLIARQNQGQEIELYKNDPLYCQTVDDCTTHITSCDPCACEQAVNKFNYQKIDCSESQTEYGDEMPVCDACPQIELGCLDHQCQIDIIIPDPNTNDSISITSPQHNDVINTPLTITGSAVGSWYFEGEFPITLYDMTNEVVATTIATAQDDWMTEDMVDFVAEIEFGPPDSEFGWLELTRNNPSEIRENDDELRVLIRFK